VGKLFPQAQTSAPATEPKAGICSGTAQAAATGIPPPLESQLNHPPGGDWVLARKRVHPVGRIGGLRVFQRGAGCVPAPGEAHAWRAAQQKSGSAPQLFPLADMRLIGRALRSGAQPQDRGKGLGELDAWQDAEQAAQQLARRYSSLFIRSARYSPAVRKFSAARKTDPARVMISSQIPSFRLMCLKECMGFKKIEIYGGCG